MYANKKEIIEVLNSGISTNELSRQTGIPVMTLSDLRNRKDDSKIDKMHFLTAIKLQTYIEENDKMKFENLQAVHFDGQHGKGDGYYTLEFNIDGEIEYIEVDEKDHPEAATDEDYFDNREIVDKIIAKK